MYFFKYDFDSLLQSQYLCTPPLYKASLDTFYLWNFFAVDIAGTLLDSIQSMLHVFIVLCIYCLALITHCYM